MFISILFSLQSFKLWLVDSSLNYEKAGLVCFSGKTCLRFFIKLGWSYIVSGLPHVRLLFLISRHFLLWDLISSCSWKFQKPCWWLRIPSNLLYAMMTQAFLLKLSMINLCTLSETMMNCSTTPMSPTLRWITVLFTSNRKTAI